ncbi:cache domain-containing protein [Hydrogenimonas sp.]
MEILKRNLSINTINLIGIGLLLLFALLFTALVVFEEYRDFEHEVGRLKTQYLQRKKEEIREQTDKVLRFIAYEYANYRGKVPADALKRQILDAVSQLYTDLASNRYIFVYRLDGTNILDPNRPELKGTNMLAVEDPLGAPILPRLIEKAKQGGGFVSYVWEKPSTKRFAPKISYAEIFEPWGWLVGTGVYLDELDRMVAQKKEAMKRRLIKYVMEILTLSAILFGFAFAGIKLINKIIRDEITTFQEFFKKAATRHVVINRSRIRIREFLPLADYVNRMVDTIHRRKRELTELNLSLEEKVRQKTAKLRKEKEFSDALVKTQDAFIKTSIHEINTPLAVIMAQIDLLKLQGGENRYVRKIEAAAKMIHTLYGDLSYLLKRHRIPDAKEPVDLAAFVRSRLDFFAEIARANRVDFRLDAAPCPKVCMNTEELTRLVDNNLSNAVKYAIPGSTVAITLSCEKKGVRLAFTNAAQEIERIEKLFEPFYKEQRESVGFGLGLYLVKGICERNGIAVSLKHEKNLVTFAYLIPTEGCHEDSAA